MDEVVSRKKTTLGTRGPEARRANEHTNGKARRFRAKVVVAAVRGEAAGKGSEEDHLGGAAGRPGSEEPHQNDSRGVTQTRHQAHRIDTVSVGHDLAL